MRYEEFRDSRLPSLRAQILSPAPIYPDLEEAVLADSLSSRTGAGGDGSAGAGALGWTLASRGGASGGDRHGALAVAARKALLDGGKAALAASQDPLIALLRRVDPQLRELRAYYDEQVQAVEVPAQAQIAEARFLAKGKSVYPDATFHAALKLWSAARLRKNDAGAVSDAVLWACSERALAWAEAAISAGTAHRAGHDAGASIRRRRSTSSIPPTRSGQLGQSGGRSARRGGRSELRQQHRESCRTATTCPEDAGSQAVAVHSVAILAALERIYDAGPLAAELRRPPVLTP